jgi:alpha-L-fucosidase
VNPYPLREVITTRILGGSRFIALLAVLALPAPLAAAGQPCAAFCAADCDGNGAVTVDELVAAVGIALGSASVDACAAGDRDGDGNITVDELVVAVTVALRGCVAPSGGTPPADLSERPLPGWYADAKLGIMIHWGPFAVPAWAERTLDPEVIFTDPADPNYFLSAQGVAAFLNHNPYSEWYWNSLAIEGSGTWQHHRDTWGSEFPYAGFAAIFAAQLDAWQPADWARIFAQAGARYVVLVSKHHDGYTLWPSQVANPQRGSDWQSPRDVVGELAAAVRARCLRMGLYYSGGIDWTWNPPPFGSLLDALRLTPPQEEYARYADAHWRELIGRYRPAVLWNDIANPAGLDAEQLFRDYYAQVPDGVVNDRWSSALAHPHADFRTSEFVVEADISPDKWEAVRGMSRGFGYNENEELADYGPPEKFVHLLIDVVSKNGNLLLNVGPRADGSIPAPQLRILAGLGTWLAANGEAIYGTRPWSRFGGLTDQGVEVRFTATPGQDVVYALLLGTPPAGALTIQGFAEIPARVRLVATDALLDWSSSPAGLRLTLPELPADGLAHAIAIQLAAPGARR